MEGSCINKEGEIKPVPSTVGRVCRENLARKRHRRPNGSTLDTKNKSIIRAPQQPSVQRENSNRLQCYTIFFLLTTLMLHFFLYHIQVLYINRQFSYKLKRLVLQMETPPTTTTTTMDSSSFASVGGCLYEPMRQQRLVHQHQQSFQYCFSVFHSI